MKRKTFGLLLHSLYNGYENQVWQDIVRITEEKDINIICFALGNPKRIIKISNNSLYYDNMLKPVNLDGLIAFSNTIVMESPVEQITSFLKSLKPLPIINVGTAIDSIHSISVNHEQGMEALIEHVIVMHNSKRIAFIKGPDGSFDAESRFSVFKRTLAKNKIPLYDELIVEGDFFKDSGKKAMQVLLDERKTVFDAVIGANDFMAISAMKELVLRGFVIGKDVAVTGFDDIEESRCGIHPLTTVRQPIYEIASAAIDALCALINHRDIPLTVTIPVQVKIRNSCGCRLHHGQTFNKESTPDNGTTIIISKLASLDISEFEPFRESISKILIKYFYNNRLDDHFPGWAASFMTIIYHAVISKQSEKGYLLSLESIVIYAWELGIEVMKWYPVVTEVFQELKVFFTVRNLPLSNVDLLWEESLDLISNIADYRFVHYDLNYQNLNAKLQSISEVLFNNDNTRQLSEIFYDQLQEWDIELFYLVKFIDPDQDMNQARVIIAFNNNGPITDQLCYKKYNNENIFPGFTKDTEKRFAYILFPLYFKSFPFGYLVCGVGRINGMTLELISRYLNNALQGANFFDIIKQQTIELETKVQLQNYILQSTNMKLDEEVRENAKMQDALNQKRKEIMELKEKLLHQTKMDYLTNIYNRSAFFELLEIEINRTTRTRQRIHKDLQNLNSQSHLLPGNSASVIENNLATFSIMIIDVDDFSKINRLYGAVIGDQVLVKISGMLLNHTIVRAEDIAARFSGEQFILILPNTNAENAFLVAKRIKNNIETAYYLDNISITVSIGIAEYTHADQTNDQIIKFAEKALTKAKSKQDIGIIIYSENPGVIDEQP